MELKSVAPLVYFSSDPPNPDTARKFYADILAFNGGIDRSRPLAVVHGCELVMAWGDRRDNRAS
jgi:hypothetical protein